MSNWLLTPEEMEIITEAIDGFLINDKQFMVTLSDPSMIPYVANKIAKAQAKKIVGRLQEHQRHDSEVIELVLSLRDWQVLCKEVLDDLP